VGELIIKKVSVLTDENRTRPISIRFLCRSNLHYVNAFLYVFFQNMTRFRYNKD